VLSFEGRSLTNDPTGRSRVVSDRESVYLLTEATNDQSLDRWRKKNDGLALF
jgi:hypothetical protein